MKRSSRIAVVASATVVVAVLVAIGYAAGVGQSTLKVKTDADVMRLLRPLQLRNTDAPRPIPASDDGPPGAIADVIKHHCAVGFYGMGRKADGYSRVFGWVCDSQAHARAGAAWLAKLKTSQGSGIIVGTNDNVLVRINASSGSIADRWASLLDLSRI